MTEEFSASTIENRFEHLREIDIDATDLVARWAPWLSTHENLWCKVKHSASFEEIPKKHMDMATVASFMQKVQPTISGHKVCWSTYKI